MSWSWIRVLTRTLVILVIQSFWLSELVTVLLVPNSVARYRYTKKRRIRDLLNAGRPHRKAFRLPVSQAVSVLAAWCVLARLQEDVS